MYCFLDVFCYNKMANAFFTIDRKLLLYCVAKAKSWLCFFSKLKGMRYHMKELEFNIDLTTGELYRFSMRHTYCSVSGAVGVLISLGSWVICATLSNVGSHGVYRTDHYWLSVHHCAAGHVISEGLEAKETE